MFLSSTLNIRKIAKILEDNPRVSLNLELRKRGKDVMSMKGARYFIGLFDEALAQNDWLENDIRRSLARYHGHSDPPDILRLQVDSYLGAVEGQYPQDVLKNTSPVFQGSPYELPKPSDNIRKRRRGAGGETGTTAGVLRRSKRIKAQN
ncbi:hypothetical protein PHLCEN_2v4143 [Hermanssonia centrifuga]|uniref:Uncharacterized protein n=1 Tax=Hermanssonia centrifuga TaxID=98765 RepID=A0A2R6PZ34_9APHY|nr:hypothetical protein PHLCEN_2v4143 [Hermanssonia centrifuga]